MPVVYRCKNCGFVLHVFQHVGQDFYGVPSPSEISSWYSGVCPKCGHRLGKPGRDDVTIRFRGFTGSILAVRRMAPGGMEGGMPVAQGVPGLGAPASQAEAGTP